MGEAHLIPVAEMSSLPKITMEDLIRRYEVLLLDAYGVLVHSRGPYPGAVDLIQRLNRKNRPLTCLPTMPPDYTRARPPGTKGSGWPSMQTES